MSDQDGFFGDIFDSPDDDPLLHSDDESAAPGSEQPSEPESPEPAPQPAHDDTAPSWMNDESFMGAGDASDDLDEQVPAEQQQVVVAPREDGPMRGVETLNEAFDHGWRLTQIGLEDRAAVASHTEQVARFVVTIERDIPRSLFDFGGAK